ncbi:MAG: tetratricopeptide repeat protein [Planctomycetota bacterium]|nr:MAG: tetratricopeptide repeat protein [Planctomycetota bacterium]
MNPSPTNPKDGSSLSFITLLFFITFLCYFNSLWGDFVFDDIHLVKQNPWVQSITTSKTAVQQSSKAISYKDSHPFSIHSLEDFQKKGFNLSYRPLRNLSYAWDALLSQTFSGRLIPFYFHLTNLLLHTINVFCIFWILKLLGFNPSSAAMGALFFAIHPVQTESVTYISGRRDLLAGSFLILSFGLYLRTLQESQRTPKRWAHYWLIYLLFLASLLTKEIAYLFPPLLLVYHFHKKEFPSSPLYHLLLWITAFLMGFLFLFWQNPIAIGFAKTGYWGGSIFTAFLSFCRAFWKYIQLVLFPLFLTVDYSFHAFPPSMGFLRPWTTLPSLLGLFLFLFAIFRYYDKLWAFALCWFLLFLLPVSQIIPHPERMAEHYLYLSLFGGSILLAFFLQKKPFLLPFFALILLLLGGRTILRNRDWQDSYHLWQSAVKVYPQCARAQMAFGKALLEKGDECSKKKSKQKEYWKEALGHIQKALVLSQNHPTSRGRAVYLNSLFLKGLCLLKLEKWKEGILVFQKLGQMKGAAGVPLESSKFHYHIHLNLGAAYFQAGNYQKAEEEYQHVLQWYPFEEQALFGLSQVYLRQKKWEKGRSLLQKGLSHSLSPKMEEAFRIQLATLFHNQGKDEESLSILEPLANSSQNPWVYYLLAESWISMKNPQKACSLFHKSLTLEPPPHLIFIIAQRLYSWESPQAGLRLLEGLVEKEIPFSLFQKIVDQMKKWGFSQKGEELWKSRFTRFSQKEKNRNPEKK